MSSLSIDRMKLSMLFGLWLMDRYLCITIIILLQIHHGRCHIYTCYQSSVIKGSGDIAYCSKTIAKYGTIENKKILLITSIKHLE